MRACLFSLALLLSASLASGQTLSVESAGVPVASESTLDNLVTEVEQLNAQAAPDAVHGENVIASGPLVQCEAGDIDGSAQPNEVTEGKSARVKCTLGGALQFAMVNEAGTVDIGASIATSLGTLDDAIFTDEAAGTYTSSKVMAFGAMAESTTDTLADNTVGIPVMTLSRFLRTTPSGYATGGATPVTMKSDNTNNDDKTAICTGPCTVYSITAFNHAATSAFLRCENDSSANTTPGSETAADGEPDFEIPGNTAGDGLHVTFPTGISYATALTCWLATGEASSDATDPALDDVTVLISRVQ